MCTEVRMFCTTLVYSSSFMKPSSGENALHTTTKLVRRQDYIILGMTLQLHNVPSVR